MSSGPGPRPDLRRGATVGRYVIIELLGSGGMGAVYRAYDPDLNRGVALKILSVDRASGRAAARARRRLLREAQALARLSHPNVVAVHDVGAFEDSVFIAMELVEGKTLRQWLGSEPRSIDEILRTMKAAGRGLSAAHKAGLVHRDFKPSNIIVGDDGRVRVLDFGLARAVERAQLANVPENESSESADATSDRSADDIDSNPTASPAPATTGSSGSSTATGDLLASPMTAAGAILGTPMYMSPEQHLGSAADARSDQFSYCVVLYQALYGALPFPGKTVRKLRDNVLNHRVTPAPKDSNIPTWLRETILRGLRPSPPDRHASLDDILDRLDSDPDARARARRASRNRKLVIAAAALIVASAVVGGWYQLRYGSVQSCKAGASDFDAAWAGRAKDKVRGAFLATKRPYAADAWRQVERTFDKYRSDWTTMHSDTCEARWLRASESEQLFDLRMTCLDERLLAFKAMVRLFAREDPQIVEKAVQASASLPTIDLCSDETALRSPYPPPTDSQTATKVEQIRARLADVAALQETGKYSEGLQLASELYKDAQTVGYAPVEAETAYHLGTLQAELGNYETAEKTFTEATETAADVKYSTLAARATIALVRTIGHQQSRLEEGVAVGRYAEILLDIAGGRERDRAQLLSSLGIISTEQGNHDKALNYLRQAQATRERLDGPLHPDVTNIKNSIGIVLRRQGKYDAALAQLEQVIQIYENTLGRLHPRLAASLVNAGLVYWNKTNYEQALQYYGRAQEIYETSLHPRHPNLAIIFNNIGNVFYDAGDFEKALTNLRRSLEIDQSALGPEHPNIAATLNNIGNVLASQGKYDDALAHFHQALQIREKSLGLKHPSLAHSLSSIGSAHVARRDYKSARPPLERLVLLCSAASCDAVAHATGLFELGRTLAALAADPKRTRNLALQARAMLVDEGAGAAKQLAQVEHWLARSSN